MLKKRGFVSLVTAQCMYVNPLSGVIIVAHVDDFLCFGDKLLLEDVVADLQKEFKCSGDMLGPEKHEVKELKFLGRRIHDVSGGLEWEGDRKHAEPFLEKLNLGNLKAVETPLVKSEDKEGGEAKAPLTGAEAKLYRGDVALANFMSQDRPDIVYASKEVAKSMSAPTSADWVPVKRLAKCTC